MDREVNFIVSCISHLMASGLAADGLLPSQEMQQIQHLPRQGDARRRRCRRRFVRRLWHRSTGKELLCGYERLGRKRRGSRGETASTRSSASPGE
jgi:hypothetical protein